MFREGPPPEPEVPYAVEEGIEAGGDIGERPALDVHGEDAGGGVGERAAVLEEEAAPSEPGAAGVDEVPAEQAFEVVTPKENVRARGRWRVVELADLITSEREGYDELLQRRDVTALKSRERVEQIKREFDAERLGESRVSSGGSPIVDSFGQVVTGNHRVWALRELGELGRLDVYHEFVAGQAAAKGLSAENFRQPTLVREVLDTGGETMERFAHLSNLPDVMEMTPAEQAESDAKELLRGGFIDAFAPDASGSVRAASNRDFLKAFVNATGDQSLWKTDGGFSPEIDRRVQRAFLAALFGKTKDSRRLVGELIERPDELGITKALDGIMVSAGGLLKLADAKPDLDLTGYLAEALHELVSFKNSLNAKSVKSLDDFLGQGELFGGRSFESEILLRELGEAKSVKSVREFFGLYLEQTQRVDTATGSLFGDEVPETGPREILEGIRRGRAEREGQAGVQGELSDAVGEGGGAGGESAVAGVGEGGVEAPVAGAGPRQLAKPKAKATPKATGKPSLFEQAHEVYPNSPMPRDIYKALLRTKKPVGGNDLFRRVKRRRLDKGSEQTLRAAIREVLEAHTDHRFTSEGDPVYLLKGRAFPSGLLTEAEIREKEKQAKEKVTPAEAPVVAESLPIRVALDDVPYASAYDAYRGTSMVPDDRAKAAQQEYVSEMRRVYDEVSDLAETDEQKALLKAELARYRDAFLKRYLAYLGAKSRVMSSMVTGPAKFPTARNQKRLATEDKRLKELLAWQENAKGSIKKKLSGARTEEQAGDAEFEVLEKKVVGAIATARGIETGKLQGLDASLFKQSLAGVLKRSANSGHVKPVRRALALLEKLQGEQLSKPFFTKRHSIWKLGERAEEAVAEEKTGEEEVGTYPGAQIVRNYDDDRTRILFDEKPGDEVRQALRGSGWKWSPRNGAWQRKNTENAVRSAEQILGAHYAEKEDDSESSGTQFSADAEGPSEVLDHQALQVIVDRMRKRWTNGPANWVILDKQEDAPERVLDAATYAFRGSYDSANDTVYLVADQFTDAKAVAHVVLHEVIGHRGFNAVVELLGEKDKNSYFARLAMGRHRDIKKYARERAMAFGTTQERRLAAQEWLADRVGAGELGALGSWWDRFVALVRKAVVRLTGIRGAEFSDEDLQELVQAAVRHAEAGETAARDELAFFSRAEGSEKGVTSEVTQKQWTAAMKEAVDFVAKLSKVPRAAEKMIRRTSARKVKDVAVWAQLLPPVHYGQVSPAYNRGFEAANENNDVRFHHQARLWDGPDGANAARAMRDFQRGHKAEYKKVQGELIRLDQNRIGERIVDNHDDTWGLVDLEGEPVPGAYSSERDAHAAMIEREVDRWSAQGFSKEAGGYVRTVRQVLGRVYYAFKEAAERFEEVLKAQGFDPSDITVRKDGKESPFLDLYDKLKTFGDLRGSYMPRIHKAGQWQVVIRKEGENPQTKFFDTERVASYWGAAKSKLQGWHASDPHQLSQPSEDALLDTSVASIQDVVNNVVERMDEAGEIPTLEALGYSAVFKNTVDDIPELVILDTTLHKKPLFLTLAIREVFRVYKAGHYDSGQGEGPGWHFKHVDEDFADLLAKEIRDAEGGASAITMRFADLFGSLVSDIIKARGSRARTIGRGQEMGEEVYEGYEKDPNRAVTSLVTSTAGGLAKHTTGERMIRAYTGTDIPWNDFFDEHRDEDVEPSTSEFYAMLRRLRVKYSEMVRGRRIQSGKQKRLWRDAMSAFREQMRNDEAMDRYFGTVRGLAAIKYLSRAATGIINLTSLAITVPPSMLTYAGIKPVAGARSLTHALNAYPQYILQEDLGGDILATQILKKAGHWTIGRLGVRLNEETRELFKAIRLRGWHKSQYNREALALAKSKFGRFGSAVADNTMASIGVTEELNRVATVAGTYMALQEKARKEGAKWDAAAKEEALHTGKLVADRAHGIYGQANLQAFARGPGAGPNVARSLLMFKTFPINMMTIQLRDMLVPGAKQSVKGVREYLKGNPQAAADILNDRVKSFGMMSLAQLVMGGPTALVGFGVIKALIQKLMEVTGIGPDDPEETVYEWMKANFGELAERIARQGLPALLGINLSGSLNTRLFDSSYRPGWIGAIETLGGAPASALVDIGEGVSDIVRGEKLKGVEKIAPAVIGTKIKAYREYTEGVTRKGHRPVFWGEEAMAPSVYDAALRFWGANPSGISAKRSEQWAETQIKRGYDDRRDAIYSRWRGWYASGKDPEERTELWKEVRAYNQRVRKQRPTGVSFMRKEMIDEMLRRAWTPSKAERNR